MVTVQRNVSMVRLKPVSARQLEDGNYRLGFVLRGEGLSPVAAAGEALRVTGLVTKEIGASLTRLVSGSGRDEISSPVGIVQGSSEAAKQGVDSYIWVLALISLSLALINLLPLLPLDGGHIAVLAYERVRDWLLRLRGKPAGGPVDYTKLTAVTMVVIFIGGAVVLLTVTADLVNPIRIGQ